MTRSRRLPARLVDGAFRRFAGLPAGAGYVRTADVRVPMRDGVELLADHYAPVGRAARGTVLIRTPYGRGGVLALGQARVFADQGYHVLVQSCRGTFGSGIDDTGGLPGGPYPFRPMQHEIDDGHDTVAWLRGRAWFDGRLATAGASYLGFVQWALLMDPPPELRTAIVLVGPHDMHRSTWGTGAFTLDDFFGWSEMLVHQEEPGMVRGLRRRATAARRLAPGMDGLPLLAAGEKVLQDKASWYRDWLGIPDGDDPFWTPLRVGAALDRVDVPVLLQTGWMDLFLGQTLEQYARLRGRGVEVGLTVGPWTHVGTITTGARTVVREQVAWLGEHLAGLAAAGRQAPVRVFVTGEGGGWRGLPAWPPSTTDEVRYLLADGGLGTEPPPAGEVTFVHDPAAPTPSVGGRMLDATAAGYRDSRVLAERDDVLTFTGPPLPQPLEIAGRPVVELAHHSDNPHVDVFVRLCDVAPDGRSVNVSDGFRRLGPAERDVRLELDATAHRFGAGHRLQLLVAGSAHPRYARNLGTGEPQATGVETRRSVRTVTLGRSRLVVPVVGR